jgi:hypothetical protein
MSIVTLKQEKREGVSVSWVDYSSRLCLCIRDYHGNKVRLCEDQVGLLEEFLAKYSLKDETAAMKECYDAMDAEAEAEEGSGS